MGSLPGPARRQEREIAPVPLRQRYSRCDVAALTPEERARFVPAGGDDPATNPALAWELLYRLEPHLYDRLAAAEHLHPAILEWLPAWVDRALEVGAGSGRLTLQLAPRCGTLLAVEPAAPLRQLLVEKLLGFPERAHVQVLDGFSDRLPVPSGWAELVVACSAFTPDDGHGGDRGLRELERCCAPGGQIVIVWPSHPEWLAERGYSYRRFPGTMAMEFADLDEAIELAGIFWPQAVPEIRRRGQARVPFEVLGSDAPRDLAYKAME